MPENGEETRKKLRWLDENCHVCGEQLNSWDARCSKALGYKHKMCERCIAKEYDRTVDDVRQIMMDWFGEMPCLGL